MSVVSRQDISCDILTKCPFPISKLERVKDAIFFNYLKNYLTVQSQNQFPHLSFEET